MSTPYRGDPSSKEKKCLQCNVELGPINVVDHTEGAVYVGLAYTKGEEMPDRSVWSGELKNAAGVIRAFMCPRCHLVAWYGSAGAPPPRM